MILLWSTYRFLGGFFTSSIQPKCFYAFLVHLMYVTRAHVSCQLTVPISWNYSFFKRARLVLESAQPPSQLDPEVLLPGVKRVGRPFSLEAKNEWNYTYTPCICLQGVYRHNISLQWIWSIKNYKLLEGQEILRRFPAGARDISLFESVQNSCGVYQFSYSIRTSSRFVDRLKQAGLWNWKLTSM
jgi:hypothetical protein